MENVKILERNVVFIGYRTVYDIIWERKLSSNIINNSTFLETYTIFFKNFIHIQCIYTYIQIFLNLQWGYSW